MRNPGINVLSIGLVRAVPAGLAAVAAGVGLAVLIRRAVGAPGWNPGPVLAVGTLTGILAYMVALGAFNYWVRWILAGKRPEEAETKTDLPRWARYFSFDLDHKVIGVQYLVTALIMLLFGVTLGFLMRYELTSPGRTIMGPNMYNHIMSLHGINQIAMILIGVSGLMNFLLPLMLGARDMPFPRLNAFSYWLLPPAGALLFASLPAGGFDTGWTVYPPLSVQAPLGMQFMILAVYLVGLSSILGGINFLTLVFKGRAPGMSLFRMPIFGWASMATSLLQMTFTQFIGMSFLMVLLERLVGMAFFVPSSGGNVVLYQHLFWFYSHPAVYVFVLPGFGIISEIIPVFSRKPIFGYAAVGLSSLGIAIGGSLVWAHHMFAAGMEPWLRIPIMITTVLVAVPTGVKVFAWISTMWMGKIRLETPMLFASTAIAVFLIGGLTGVPLGIVPADLYVTDTYYIVGHFHHTMFGGFVFPLMAAIYYWFPKVTGRFMNERLGRVHWAIMTTGFFTTFLPFFWLGLNGLRRRVYDYDPSDPFQTLNIVSTVGAGLLVTSFFLVAINIITSAIWGLRAGANPWRAKTLEWQVASPAPDENFETPPRVVDTPYGYGRPGSVHAIMSTGGAEGDN
ncbi:MAG: cbb3-type cytochrome c oxidase subunit I [Chloroflexi bacterium]|nr:cbb3-type cytochrome c oxidase subunit I [Chloroflexota bacterium]